MGGCFSDVKGGKQAVGGGHQRPINRDGDVNDAVELFNRARGVESLCTPLEVTYILPQSYCFGFFKTLEHIRLIFVYLLVKQQD